MIDIETQLRSYQHATNVRLEVRQMTGRAADEIKRLRSALNDIARGGHSSLESARHRAEIALNDEQASVTFSGVSVGSPDSPRTAISHGKVEQIAQADHDEQGPLPRAKDVRGILKQE